MNREYLNFAQNQPNVMSDEKTLTVDLEKVIGIKIRRWRVCYRAS